MVGIPGPVGVLLEGEVFVVGVLGDEPSDADLAEMVDDLSELVHVLVEVVCVLVEKGEKQLAPPPHQHCPASPN
jgi:hypothetical protein